ncbi:MAG: PAS domain S-box protein [Desulfatitalea sp.]|nr:PAS domain S-box protein [Desulfatitalea sp.]
MSDDAKVQRLEIEIAELRRRLAVLMVNINGMAYRCANDAAWTMIDVSPGSEALTGYPPESLIGNRQVAYGDLIHPEDRQAVWDAIQAALQLRETFRLAYRLRHAAGSTRWVWEQGCGVFAEDGTLLALEGVVSDISERIEVQKTLQASERKYRLLADNTLDAIWTMDLDLLFTYVNPASLAITGYAPEAFVGTHLQDHCDPENFQRMAEAVAQGMIDGPQGSGVIFEAVMLRKNREPFPVEIHGKVIFDAHGQPVGLQGITRDITDRLAAEQERRKLQEQLYQAQKMESVGRLAGGVAHDFNNLLSVVLGYGEMILDDLPIDHPHHDALHEIHNAANRAKVLTRQLLAFSRKQILEMQTVDINGVVTGFQKLLRRIIGEDIVLEFSLDAGPLRVRADTAQLEQVLLNLAVNARDAMVDGGTLTIETAAVALDPVYANGKTGVRPGRYAMIAVTDTGPGMDRETLGHLFEPFFTTKSKDQGTGLGLATSYGIVKQHEGNIWAYSESGHGTTFKIYLPLTEQPVARPDDMDSPKTPVTTASLATVLVVEDDLAVRRLVCNFLGRGGYRVIESQTAVHAIQLAREHTTPIDLVLTDVIMPVMKGNEVFEAVRRHHPAARVLYMSGYTDNVIARRGILDRGVAFLQKPFSREALLAKVREVLEAA